MMTNEARRRRCEQEESGVRRPIPGGRVGLGGPDFRYAGAYLAHPPGPPETVFSFLYFLKIKISKIYVGFEIFQKYTPVALP